MNELEVNKNETLFDMDDNKKRVIYQIDDCKIVLKRKDILKYVFVGGNIGTETIEEMRVKLNLGKYSKAPCGGFPNFYKTSCKKSNKSFIFFFGISEVYNSIFIINIHNLYEV
jgi:hypothetical protein